MKPLGAIVASTLVLLEVGCCSDRSVYTLRSRPSNCSVYVNDKEMGRTPLEVTLEFDTRWGGTNFGCLHDGPVHEIAVHPPESSSGLYVQKKRIMASFVGGELDFDLSVKPYDD